MELMELSVVVFVDLVKNFRKIVLFVEYTIVFFKGRDGSGQFLYPRVVGFWDFGYFLGLPLGQRNKGSG